MQLPIRLLLVTLCWIVATTTGQSDGPLPTCLSFHRLWVADLGHGIFDYAVAPNPVSHDDDGGSGWLPVVVMSSNGTAGSPLWVAAILPVGDSLSTYKVKWNATLPAGVSDGLVFWGHSSVFVVTGQVGNSTPATLYSLDPSTGRRGWSLHLNTTAPSVARPVESFDASIVFAGLGTQLIAVEASTGKLLWKFEPGGAHLHVPVAIVISTDQPFLAMQANIPPLYFPPHQFLLYKISWLGTTNTSQLRFQVDWTVSSETSIDKLRPVRAIITPHTIISTATAPHSTVQLVAYNLFNGSLNWTASPTENLINAHVSYSPLHERLLVPGFQSLSGHDASGGRLTWYDNFDFVEFNRVRNGHNFSSLNYVNTVAIDDSTGLGFFTATNFTADGINPLLCAAFVRTGRFLGCVAEPFTSAGGGDFGEAGYGPKLANTNSTNANLVFTRNDTHLLLYSVQVSH